jgi:uncharacterized lipoprotein YmbA
MFKKILILLIPLLFVGCGSKQLYTLGDTSSIRGESQSINQFIAVEKVELPIYFMDSPIYKKDSPFHLKKIGNAHWINTMDQHLTNVLISYLQKAMKNPNIYKYPWSNVKKIDKRLALNISKFISYKNIVSLDANYQILDKNKRVSSNNLFSTEIKTKDNSIESMIDAMEKAYFQLTDDIKQKL